MLHDIKPQKKHGVDTSIRQSERIERHLSERDSEDESSGTW